MKKIAEKRGLKTADFQAGKAVGEPIDYQCLKARANTFISPIARVFD